MTASLQDFSLLQSTLENYKRDFELTDLPDAFMFLVIDLILSLQSDEIEDAITDNNYLVKRGSHEGGHDRGIDAIHIDDAGENHKKPVIHLFNFKYKTTFNGLNGSFPAAEIDKIVNFLSALLAKETGIRDTVNPILYGKIEEIWRIFDRTNPDFIIHLCSNQYVGLEPGENERFKREVNRHSNMAIQSTLMPDVIALITKKNKQEVHAKLKAIDRNFFEKSDGDIRALIVNIDARELLRIVIDNELLRQTTDLITYEELKDNQILEDAFEDNVRVYARQRSKINRGIKKTALSDENHRFFYFNNGITITCERFQYARTVRSPIIELQDLQIVNGGQTIHALFEAFVESPAQLENIDILCRIYETQNLELSTKIAEYTNSQNPVSSRDIRAIDIVQQKLESEFLAKGYYYERKKNQYSNYPKSKRLDAEKVGQVLLAFNNQMVADPKDDKRFIFGTLYDTIFNDDINADKVLLAYQLFEFIEREKNVAKSALLSLSDINKYETGAYILYASYYILYLLGLLADKKGIARTYNNIGEIKAQYDMADDILKSIVKIEQRTKTSDSLKYSHPIFLKSSKPKKLLEDYFSTHNI